MADASDTGGTPGPQGPRKSALQAWAATRLSGAEATDADRAGDVGRAPGHAHHDPADVINVFLGAAESGRRRNDDARHGARDAPEEDHPS